MPATVKISAPFIADRMGRDHDQMRLTLAGSVALGEPF